MSTIDKPNSMFSPTVMADENLKYKQRFGGKSNCFCISENNVLSSVTREATPKLETNLTAVERWFRCMDTKQEGKITSKELQHAFEIFQGKHFSEAVCKFVVRIFDLDKNGGVDIKEFETLYYYIKIWLKAFNNFDKEGKGFLTEPELDYALRQLDINFSPEFIKFLITRNNPGGKVISLDQYIITCIQIQKFTEEFKSRDPDFTGNINITYEGFLEMVLSCL